MDKIRPDAPINKLLKGLESAKRQIRQLEIAKEDSDSIVKNLRSRPNLREAGELSARLVDTLASDENALDAQAGGLSEDRVNALLNDED